MVLRRVSCDRLQTISRGTQGVQVRVRTRMVDLVGVRNVLLVVSENGAAPQIQARTSESNLVMEEEKSAASLLFTFGNTWMQAI